ncbi:MAG: ROK family protein [Microscillaceae bacterium]|nr:ROK family protein [Microscillaceae bacterium]MDW8461391.1 ROK family protein [Cytophagales bacterium]
MKTRAVLGIDIGGTTTTFGFTDQQGNIFEERIIPTYAEQHITQYLPRLYKAIDEMYEKYKEEIEWVGIGIGAPNANYLRGTIENPPNLKWGGIIPLAQIFEEKYQKPTVITNDANAAAIGEMLYGAARGMKNFILLTLGTGLGSGIVVNGEVVYGHTGFAGEMGHIIVNEEGRVCGDGRRGCLEAYVSVTGIKRTVAKLLADYNHIGALSKVSFEELTGEMICQAALQGDKIALEAFEYTGKILGTKLADAVLFTSPEAIILFGGLARAKDFILQPTLRYMEQRMFGPFKGTVKLMLSELQDKNAAVLGASALIWKELEKKK